jgi:hypothetical protein
MRRSSPEIIEIVMNVSLALRLAAEVLACACECETRGRQRWSEPRGARQG